MSDAKRYLKVGLTLGAIAGVSALLIGATNAVTAPAIEKNERDRLISALEAPFGKNATVNPDEKLDLSNYTLSYVQDAWEAKGNDGNKVGTVYQCEGTNMYGSISLLIGVYPDGSLTDMTILSNTETYKTTLESKYVRSFNSAETADKMASLNNVKCGATFGANTINAMVSEARNLAMGGGKSIDAGLNDTAKSVYGEKANRYAEFGLSTYIVNYVTHGYTASKDEDSNVVGNLYTVGVKLADGSKADVYVGVDNSKDYAFVGAASESRDPDLVSFLNSFNAASDKSAYLDSVSGGSSSSIGTGATDIHDFFDHGEKGDDSSSSGLVGDLKSGFLEARSISNGTIAQDARFACFENGEVDGFSPIAVTGKTYIQSLSMATKGGNNVAYLYELHGTNTTGGGTKQMTVYFSIYVDGSLGKIALESWDQTAGFDNKIQTLFIDAFNKATPEGRKKFLTDDMKSVVAGASSGADLLQKMIKEAVQDEGGR